MMFHVLNIILFKLASSYWLNNVKKCDIPLSRNRHTNSWISFSPPYVRGAFVTIFNYTINEHTVVSKRRYIYVISFGFQPTRSSRVGLYFILSGAPETAKIFYWIGMVFVSAWFIIIYLRLVDSLLFFWFRFACKIGTNMICN